MPQSQLGRPRKPDDSRSDASSVATKDHLSTMSTSGVSKNKKPIPNYPTQNGTVQRPTQNASSSAVAELGEHDLPRIPWHDMDLKDLHNYRHAHRLNTSSSYINSQANVIFANAARKGIYSPSVVAARRKQRELKKNRREMAAGNKERSSSRLKGIADGAGNASHVDLDESGRQSKEQLAMAVRKHFNAMSVSEGEVVARFTYVVRHMAGSVDADQDQGFRMRFKP